MQKVSSISANIGVAPVYITLFDVATNVSAVVAAKSPEPNPAAFIAPCNAAVPLENVTACFTPAYSANDFSKASTVGPIVSQSPRKTFTTSAISSSFIHCRPYDSVNYLSSFNCNATFPALPGISPISILHFGNFRDFPAISLSVRNSTPIFLHLSRKSENVLCIIPPSISV